MSGNPTPERIAAGQAPGGLVVNYYAPDGEVVLSRQLVDDGRPVEVFGLVDLLAATEGRTSHVVMAVYDGDTGERFVSSDDPLPWQ